MEVGTKIHEYNDVKMKSGSTKPLYELRCMQEKQNQLRNQLNQDCVLFNEKSYVKYTVQCKNKENGPGEIERFKILTAKQI